MAYIGYSKSVRAVQAENDGLMTATDMAKWLRRYIKGITAFDIKEVLLPSEWHHTSCRYNCTNYYNPINLENFKIRRALRRCRDHRVAEKRAGRKFGGMHREWYGVFSA